MMLGKFAIVLIALMVAMWLLGGLLRQRTRKR